MPNQVTNEEAAEVLADAAVETAEAPAPAEEPIQIGEKTFATQAEALAYARSAITQKEQELALVEAYNAGLVEGGGASAPAVPAAAPEPDNWEERFYANPKSTLQELREEIKREVLGSVRGQSEEEKLWSEFERRHPDLEGFREDAQTILTKYDKEVRALASTKGKDQAMDFLAQKTRAKFEEYAERRKPKRELPNTGGAMLPTTQTNVTKISKEKEEKPLSFVDQVRQNRLKRM